MSKILNEIEGENTSQRYIRFRLTSVVSQILALLIIVLVFLGALNYFSLLPTSSKLPFLSFLPTAKGTPGLCKVVESKFCSQGELLSWTDANGVKWDWIGFNLPKNTPVFAPIKGSFSKREGGILNGISIGLKDIENPDSVTFTFVGDLAFDNMLAVNNIKPGDEITRIGDKGTTNFGGYNFAVTSNQKIGVASDIFKQLFPETFKKPAKQVVYTAPVNQNITKGTPIYSDNPPR